MARLFMTLVVLRPFVQKGHLLVTFLTEKSYICVKKYDDSKLTYVGVQIIRVYCSKLGS